VFGVGLAYRMLACTKDRGEAWLDETATSSDHHGGRGKLDIAVANLGSYPVADFSVACDKGLVADVGSTPKASYISIQCLWNSRCSGLVETLPVGLHHGMLCLGSC
jgi:hypothetical protein